VSVDLGAFGTGQVENLDPAPTTVTLTLTPTVQASRPDTSAIASATTAFGLTQALAAFDGTLDFAGPSGLTHDWPLAHATASSTLTAPSDLALFQGTGPGDTIQLGLSATSMSSVASGGSAAASFFVQTAATLTVCYQYDPAVPFCAGDGSGAACPCGNASAPGADQGCLNSLGLGAELRGTGSASLAQDTLTLTCSNLPATASVLFFQGSDEVAAGASAVFGDGLRCAGGTLARLGARAAVAGVASFPSAGGLGSAGGASAGTTLRYQAWYRNPAPHCTPAAFNLSNGLRVRWTP
jgi:hypothetical protein